MKLSQLKHIIKEELKNLQRSSVITEKEKCGGSCSVTVNGVTHEGSCKSSMFGAFCRCNAGPHTIDCEAGSESPSDAPPRYESADTPPMD